MSENCRYDTKSAKEILLDRASEVYFEIGRLTGNDNYPYLEEELAGNAVFKVLEKDTDSKKQFMELVGLSYMLQGIATNLRLSNGSIRDILTTDFNGEITPNDEQI